MPFNDVIPGFILDEMLEQIREQRKSRPKLNLIPMFEIDEAFLTSITIKWMCTQTTEGTSYGTLAQTVDHPAFDALRRHLAAIELIKIPDYPCWNGDTVLSPFFLNNKLFNKGDRFLCACAIKYDLQQFNKSSN